MCDEQQEDSGTGTEQVKGKRRERTRSKGPGGEAKNCDFYAE